MISGLQQLEQDLAHAWGYVYKITHRPSGRFLVGSHFTEAGEALDFHYGEDESLLAAVREEGEEAFERKILTLVSSREEAYVQEVFYHALSCVTHGEDCYTAPFGATSTARKVLVEAIGGTSPAEVITFFEDLDLEDRYLLYERIHEALKDPHEQGQELSSLTLPTATEPE